MKLKREEKKNMKLNLVLRIRNFEQVRCLSLLFSH